MNQLIIWEGELANNYNIGVNHNGYHFSNAPDEWGNVFIHLKSCFVEFIVPSPYKYHFLFPQDYRANMIIFIITDEEIEAVHNLQHSL